MPPKVNQEQTALKQKADTFYKNQQFQQAIEFYTQAINADPSCEAAAALFSNRSLCNHKVNNFEEALNDGISATSIRPDWSRGYLRVATAAEALQKNEQALEAYEKCLELDKHSDDEIKIKFLRLFKNHLEDVIAPSKSQDELKLLGNDYVSKQKYDEALLVYTAAIDLDPSVESAAAIYSNRSLCNMNLGKFEAAFEDGSMATALRPEWPRGWSRTAHAAVKISKFEDAVQAFEKYFELDPSARQRDSDAVRSLTQCRSEVEKEAAAKRQREHKLQQLKKDIMSQPEGERRQKRAMTVLVSHLRTNASVNSVDVGAIRIAIECGAQLGVRIAEAHEQYVEAGIQVCVLSDMIDRRRFPFPPSVSLKEYDELIFELIDKYVKENIPIAKSALPFACGWEKSRVPNPDIVQALLQTGRFDPNEKGPRGIFPLLLLMGNTDQLNPPDPGVPAPEPVLDCLRMILNCKGINPNVQSPVRGGDGASTPLMMTFHAEIAKLLIRHGADVNFQTHRKSLNHDINVLSEALYKTSFRHNGSELLRVLIGAGSKFIADGPGGKSTSGLYGLFANAEGNSLLYPSEDSLQLVLQQLKKQGLDFVVIYKGNRMTLLSVAVRHGAPNRLIEILCGMAPQMLQESSDLTGLLGFAIMQKYKTVEETVALLEMFIDHGLDLLETCSIAGHRDFASTRFASLYLFASQMPHLQQPLTDLVVRKKGASYLHRCMASFNETAARLSSNI